MTTHIGFCEDCYTSHVGRVRIVIYCKAHGGGSYVMSFDDEYDDDAKTERTPAREAIDRHYEELDRHYEELAHTAARDWPYR